MRFFNGPGVLIIDELGCLPMPAEDANALFQVISQRYLRGSIILTTNRGVASWGDIFDDTTIAAAMLDRLLHQRHSSTSPATATACAPTEPAQRSSPKEAPPRVTPAQGGEFR
jgi:hypothetical protein